MKDIEDRLRAAYRSATDTVRQDSLRGLDEQAAVISFPARPARLLRDRWLMPVTASVAAAAVVVALAVVVPRVLASRGDDGNQAAVVAGSPATKYLVGIGGPGAGNLTVNSVLTGATLDSLAPWQPGRSYTAAATGDGRNYVYAVSKKGSCGSSLRTFRITSRGAIRRSLQGRTESVDETIERMAASQNGRVLALAGTMCSRSGVAVLSAMNLVTRRSTQWTLTGLAGSASGVDSLSLTAYGRDLVFSTARAVYVLPASAPAGTAAQRSHPVIEAQRFGAGARITSATITPNGRTIYFSVTSGSGWLVGSVSVTGGRVSGPLRQRADFQGGHVINLVFSPSAGEAIAFVRYPQPQPSASPSSTPTPTPHTVTPVPTVSPSRIPPPPATPSNSPVPEPSRSPQPPVSISPSPTLVPTPSPSGSPLSSETARATMSATLAAETALTDEALYTVDTISFVRHTVTTRPQDSWNLPAYRYFW
jgi:hypothetical protein